MSEKQLVIYAELEAAFGKTQLPAGTPITCSNSLEAAEVADFFKGKDWQNITLKSLQDDYIGDGSACLTFMSPLAAVCYLPAYLKIACLDFYEADAISGELFPKLLRGLRDDTNAMGIGLRLLDDQQNTAIARCLDFLSKEYLYKERENEAQEALDLFWGKFLLPPKQE